jgi:hypothetical protein
VLVDSQRDWQRTWSVDLSASGVAITGLLTAPIGQRVELYFELPCGVAVETQAKVVRYVSERTALEFVGLGHDALVALRAHCRVIDARA